MLLYPLQSTAAEGYHSHISIPLLPANQVLGGVSDVVAAVVREKEERELKEVKEDKETSGEAGKGE